MNLVCTKRYTEFCDSHGGLTEIVPFTTNKNKYFKVQMVAYTMVDVNSEQGQGVISSHIIELPVNICINFKIEV